MSICKDCFHFEACLAFYSSEISYKSEEEDRKQFGNNEGCGRFKSAADVVEVVRCKDCIARPQNYLEPFACARNNILVYGNSFCSFGKRSENERTLKEND